jgi:hypothetical protein
LPFPRLIKALNELRTHLQLSLDEKDYGESTTANLKQIVEEGSANECDELKSAFEVIKIIIKINKIQTAILREFARLFGTLDRPIGRNK